MFVARLAVLALVAPAALAAAFLDAAPQFVAGEANERLGRGITLKNGWLLVGAQGAGYDVDTDGGGLTHGRVQVFTSDGSSWVFDHEFLASDSETKNFFGHEIDMYEDTVIVGAMGSTVSGMGEAGKAYVFRFDHGSGVFVEEQILVPPSPAVESQYGRSVAIYGEWAAVGEREYGTGGVGKAFTYKNIGGTWTLVSTLNPTDPDGGNSFFGTSIELTANWLVVCGLDNGADVYKMESNAWTFQENIYQSTHPGGSTGNFCRAAAIDENERWLVLSDHEGDPDSVNIYEMESGSWAYHSTIGLSYDDGDMGTDVEISTLTSDGVIAFGGPNLGYYGAAYIWTYNAGTDTWEEALVYDGETDLQSLTGYTLADLEYNHFGNAVAVEGTTVVVGAWRAGEDTAISDSGLFVTFGFAITAAFGDPVIVDFGGHRFFGGRSSNTEYVLYRSQDGADEISMTTGLVEGMERGYFAQAITIKRGGCGAMTATASMTVHRTQLIGDACMTDLVAHGDDGLVLVPMKGGAIVAINPHHVPGRFSFVNLKMTLVTKEFRLGCTGMLCDEMHHDVIAE